jgi:hypothetical protein
VTFTKCAFADNQATQGAPLIAKSGQPTITVTNCSGIVPAFDIVDVPQ